MQAFHFCSADDAAGHTSAALNDGIAEVAHSTHARNASSVSSHTSISEREGLSRKKHRRKLRSDGIAKVAKPADLNAETPQPTMASPTLSDGIAETAQPTKATAWFDLTSNDETAEAEDEVPEVQPASPALSAGITEVAKSYQPAQGVPDLTSPAPLDGITEVAKSYQPSQSVPEFIAISDLQAALHALPSTLPRFRQCAIQLPQPAMPVPELGSQMAEFHSLLSDKDSEIALLRYELANAQSELTLQQAMHHKDSEMDLLRQELANTQSELVDKQAMHHQQLSAKDTDIERILQAHATTQGSLEVQQAMHHQQLIDHRREWEQQQSELRADIDVHIEMYKDLDLQHAMQSQLLTDENAEVAYLRNRLAHVQTLNEQLISGLHKSRLVAKMYEEKSAAQDHAQVVTEGILAATRAEASSVDGEYQRMEELCYCEASELQQLRTHLQELANTH